MQKPETRAAIYARIATAPQGTEPDPLLVQIDASKTFCAEQGYTLSPSHIYREVCQAATSRNCPQLAALLAAAKHGAFAVVVVFAYDRLARQQTEVASLVATLENYGLRVRSVNEPCGNGLVEEMMHQMLSNLHAAVDQMEREQRAKRRHGARKAKEQ